jgi:hypothetical protein
VFLFSVARRRRVCLGPAGPESQNPAIRQPGAFVGDQEGEAQVEAQCQQKLRGE